jgi:hypothetical protein
VQLLRPRQAVHPRGPLRVWPLAAAPQPEQHPSYGDIRGNVRGVLGDKCPLASLPVLLHVCVLEGRLQGGDNRLRQPLDEAMLG